MVVSEASALVEAVSSPGGWRELMIHVLPGLVPIREGSEEPLAQL